MFRYKNKYHARIPVLAPDRSCAPGGPDMPKPPRVVPIRREAGAPPGLNPSRHGRLMADHDGGAGPARKDGSRVPGRLISPTCNAPAPPHRACSPPPESATTRNSPRTGAGERAPGDRASHGRAIGHAHAGPPIRSACTGRRVAGAGGFEPPHGGIKIRCLTTWRRPTGPGVIRSPAAQVKAGLEPRAARFYHGARLHHRSESAP